MFARHVCRLLGLCCVLLPARIGVASVSEITYQGRPCVLLENRFLRMVISPSEGGMCALMEHRPSGKRFTVPGEATLVNRRRNARAARVPR